MELQAPLADVPPLDLPLSQEALRDWMVDYVARLLSLDPTRLDTSARFDAFGIDSIEAVVMAGVMEEDFGLPVEPSLLFVYPSIDAFAAANCRKG